MTQQEICEQLLSTIQESPIYEKFGVFGYRFPFERIETVIDGKLETTQMCICTDKVVMKGPKGELYCIDNSAFEKKYEFADKQQVWTPDMGTEFGLVKAKGKINAIRVTSDNFVPSFVAAWGEQMNVTLGGYYACPVDGNEVYFIDEEVFNQTYKFLDA